MSKSKKRQLLEWIRTEGAVSSAQIYKWGDDHFSHRAKRNARQLRDDGDIDAMTKESSIFVWYKTKETPLPPGYTIKEKEDKTDSIKNIPSLSLKPEIFKTQQNLPLEV